MSRGEARLIAPYFREEGITIYHGDCADVAPTLELDKMDLVLTDPPYGIGWKAPTVTGGLRHQTRQTHNTKKVVGDEMFDASWLFDFPRAVIFGANYFPHPVGGLIVWDKTGGGKASTFLPGAEVAWTNLFNGCEIFHHLWSGAFRDYVDDEWRAVPGSLSRRKPTRLMRWIIEKWTEPNDVVFDPYMGSGPVAQACFELGRRYIGIEIEEEYCKTATDRRFNQRTLPL